MLCGLLAIAAVTEQALAHPELPLAASSRLALAIGVVLFVCGTAAVLWRATGRTAVARWVLAPAAGAAVVAAGAASWAAMSMVLAMLVLVAVIEERRATLPKLPGRSGVAHGSSRV